MRRIAFVGLALLCLATPSVAQKVKTVSGTYIYMVPETQSYAEAKETALQRAKIQILADTFGTVMDLSSATSITGDGTQLHALSQSQVKGEWLKTIGEPVITRIFDGEQMAVKVEIKGKVREITSASTEFTVKVLRGAPDPRFEGESFQSGEDKIVKKIFKEKTVIEGNRRNDYIIPNQEVEFALVNKDVITASEEELEINHRSKSAKLRIIKRIKKGNTK